MSKYTSTPKPRPLAALALFTRHRRLSIGIGGGALISMVTAFALTDANQIDAITPQIVLEQLSTSITTLSTDEPHGFLREESIQRSDTIANLANRLGITEASAHAFIRENRAAREISRQLRPGKVVTATTTAKGELLSLYFPLNGKDAVLVVERQNDGFIAQERVLRLERQTVIKSGEIQSSLFEAADDANIPDAIATQLAEVFSGDIDFHRGLRKGDRFSLVYEVLTHRGQLIRTGRILSAEFINDQRQLNAYWFQTGEGKGGYYTAEGKSLRRPFLRSPLEFSRVTSGFARARLHPVLQTWRAHKGIDYGAPTGTRVRSVADGTVTYAGKKTGYGNIIVVRHQGNYSTAYGHLNGFASGLRTGTRVSQGETIGYVGQTGLATGPHLHYEFRVNDQQVDPLRLALPSTTPLEASQIGHFKATTAPLLRQLELAKQMTLATSE